MKLLWTALFLTLSPLTALASEQTKSPLVVLPAAIELGEQRPDTNHAQSIWLVNDSDQALELRGVKGGCGCVQVPGFEPTTLAAHGAMELHVTVRAPKQDGKRKQTQLALHTSQGDTLVPVQILANSAAPAAATIAAATITEANSKRAKLVAAPAAVRLISPEVVLELPLGGEAQQEFWLVNTSPLAVGIEAVRASCGCVKAAQLPDTIQAGQALRIPVTVKASKKPKLDGQRWLDVRLDSSEVLRLPLVVTTLEPAGV